MPVSCYEYDPNLTFVGQPNVFVDVKNPVNHVNKSLYIALNNLVLTRPQWRFKIVDCIRLNNAETLATDIKIYEDGEYLGSVGIAYKGRSYKLQVTNDRINAKRERGRGYHTDDPAKAELRIRKTFFRLAKDERLSKARDLASGVIGREHSSKSYEFRQANENVFADSKKFAANNLEMYLAAHPSRVQYLEKYKRDKAEYSVVARVQKCFDSKEAALVVLDGTQYLVQIKDATNVYTDETLPYDMRMKLGMLKLVEDKQMISDVGCRVDQFTYVLVPESQEKEQA